MQLFFLNSVLLFTLANVGFSECYFDVLINPPRIRVDFFLRWDLCCIALIHRLNGEYCAMLGVFLEDELPPPAHVSG